MHGHLYIKGLCETSQTRTGTFMGFATMLASSCPVTEVSCRQFYRRGWNWQASEDIVKTCFLSFCCRYVAQCVSGWAWKFGTYPDYNSGLQIWNRRIRVIAFEFSEKCGTFQLNCRETLSMLDFCMDVYVNIPRKLLSRPSICMCRTVSVLRAPNLEE